MAGTIPLFVKGIKGILKTGLGEGGKFISMNHYRNEITKNVGFYPFAGTLNIEVDENEMHNFLESFGEDDRIEIKGFEENGKKYGGAVCMMARVMDEDVAIIIPAINKHKNILEIISPHNLREKLKLSDGDILEVEAL